MERSPLFGKEGPGEIFYYHADGLGSVVALTDANGKTVESYAYSPFGELKRKGDKVKNTYTFTGREWDKEVKLYYYRARYYDPKTGRFISKDPIGFAGGDANLYGYVGENPVNFKDPLGLFLFPITTHPDLYGPKPHSPYDPYFGPNNCSQYPAGSIERQVCEGSGDDAQMNCVRKCLKDKYPGTCENTPPLKDKVTPIVKTENRVVFGVDLPALV